MAEPNITVTPEGYIICHRIIYATPYPLLYKPSEPAVAGCVAADDGMVHVLRPWAWLCNAGFVASLRLRPLTLLHPRQDIMADNVVGEGIGVVLSAAPGDKGDIIGSAIIYDKAAGDMLLSGWDNVSIGYDHRLYPVSVDGRPRQGYYLQYPVMANHVAIVPRARSSGAGIEI